MSTDKIIIQEESKNCPGIVFYPETNRLEIFGRAIPENPEPVFLNLDGWVTQHFAENNGLQVDIRLEYINSGSSKYMYALLKKLTGYSREGKHVLMKWLYEEDDEGMLELGEHYRDTAGIPLELRMIV